MRPPRLALVALVAGVALVSAACQPGTASAPAPGPPPPGYNAPDDAPTLSIDCPVRGSTYANDYGPRGSGFHAGVDMFVPTGTPVRAVRAGTVRNVPNEGAGGNVVYLTADDGNVYMTVHLDSFVGGDRAVARGALIGYSGMTGNATAPHVHFEIRLGGVNGTRVNPYPSLRAAGC